jgi:hypothetical protein
LQPGSTTRSPQANVAIPTLLSAGDHNHSLAEMAQRDLDAALQLLADRAQYITGAGGAAIALRRGGKNDMLCRASTGPNAPELGALLSMELGLSGESVRTRRPLRCDDAGRDTRVNHEVCRQMGIASVAVMPVLQDDEVLGVFELFSGKVNAFADRDLSALRRLSEMVETAVRLAQAAESLPELQLTAPAREVVADEVLDLPDWAVEATLESAVKPDSEPVLEVETEAVPELSAETVALPPAVAAPVIAEPPSFPQPEAPPIQPVAPKRPLFWSATLAQSTEGEKPAEPDQSHVPPMLRNLRKCEICGFPVSAGRVLCVECEEKKWRGQLRSSQPATRQAAPAAARAFATAAPSSAVSAPIPQRGPVARTVTTGASRPAPATPAVDVPAKAVPAPPAPQPLANQAISDAAAEKRQPAPPELVLSAGLEPSQSWFSRNKYILAALLVVAGVVAAILLLR